MAKINLNHYKSQIPYITAILKNDQIRGISIDDTASLISASISGIPIIVSYSIISLELGKTPAIMEKIEKLKAFYQIEEIIEFEGLDVSK